MSIDTAEQLEENEQWEKAYEEYKKIHAKKPKSIEVLGRLGHVALILEKPEEAAEYYSKIIDLDATNTVAYEQLMDVYFHTDRYKYYIARGNLHILQKELNHAINDFKKALDKAETEEETNTIRFALAGLYEQVGKNNQSIDEYLRILDTSALNEIVFLNLAQVYLKEDSIASAVEILERAVEKGFDTPKVKESLAQLYLRNNQPELARKSTQNKLVEVKSLLEEDKNQAAFDILTEIKNEYKNNAEYHLLLAQYYFNNKKWEESLASVNDFEKYQKNSPLIYQMRALIYEEKEDEFESHINWAKYYLLRGEKDVALNEYYQANNVEPKNAILLRDIAELLEDVGDKVQACEFWEKLSDVDLNNRKALEKIAEFRKSIGDYRGEADFLEKLYNIDKKNPEIIKKLAIVYEKIKNKEKALEFYNLFVSISPINDEIEQIKIKIQKLQKINMEEDDGFLEKIIKIFSRK